jgi:hypothetical protein
MQRLDGRRDVRWRRRVHEVDEESDVEIVEVNESDLLGDGRDRSGRCGEQLKTADRFVEREGEDSGEGGRRVCIQLAARFGPKRLWGRMQGDMYPQQSKKGQ